MCIDLGVINDIKELDENLQAIVLAQGGGLLQNKRREARKESWGTANISEVDRERKHFW